MGLYDTHVKSQLINENKFYSKKPEDKKLPVFEDIKYILPNSFWEDHQSTIDCYYKTWQLAFKNLEKPSKESGFITNFIDTAFNDCIFMWDSAFMLLFARYADRIFKFQKTLDNFYAKQHDDGFICREINKHTGLDTWQRYDPSSTGPNTFPWTEWEYYLNFNDIKRLNDVFPVLLAYHRWLKKYRTWKDGTYWSSGYGCGMDNQPRVDDGCSPQFDHSHLSWADTTLQQIYSGKILVKMAKEVGRYSEISDILEEIKSLSQIANNKMWNDEQAFYFDLRRNGEQSDVKIIGGYWALIAEIVPKEKLERFISHLNNKNEFDTTHRIPSLSKDNSEYDPTGNYWKGGVWTVTNYMVLKGLERNGCEELAHEIAKNHLSNVVRVFEKTDTIWEAYSPEEATPAKIHGRWVKKDFVGFSGLPPIAVLFENVFGIRANAADSKIVWDVRLTEAHGVSNYPFKKKGLVNLKCNKRQSANDKPMIEVSSNISFNLEVRWENKKEVISVKAQDI